MIDNHGPTWLSDAAEALGEVRPEDGAPLCLNWNQVLVAIRDLRAERDEARGHYRWMVERAADQRLDGYRELGARAAAAENERDDLRAERDAARDRALTAEIEYALVLADRNDAQEQLRALRRELAARRAVDEWMRSGRRGVIAAPGLLSAVDYSGDRPDIDAQGTDYPALATALGLDWEPKETT